ncbi:MAG: HDOD domain-containing protein [Pseudomonadota bacterium]
MANYYIGRQPIFDANLDLFAYELLFRDTASDSANVVCGEVATSQVIVNTLTEIGIDNLVGPHKVFLNLTEHFITRPDLILFEPDKTVLEILENVEASEEIIAGVQALRDKGYTIALDDFVYRPDLEPLIELADMIKIDISLLDDATLRETVARIKQAGKKLLAEKVETFDQFEQLKTMDFDFYQGYFFAKPNVISGKKIPGNQLSLMELATKIHQPDIDIDELHDLVSVDIALSVKALRFANSAQNGLRNEVVSLKQAITLLGLATLKNWVAILLMADIDEKPTELVTLALIRARMCQLLAQEAEIEKPENFFTVGLFSVLDALLDSDMESILESLPLQKELSEALISHTGAHGSALECAMSMEIADSDAASFCDIEAPVINDIYLSALKWADESRQTLH